MLALLFGATALAGGFGLAGFATLSRPVTQPAAEVAVPAPPDQDGLSPWFRRAAALASTLSRPGHQQRTQRRLDLAGNPRSWEPERLLAFRGFGLVAGLVLGLLTATHGGIWVVAGPVGFAAAGFLLPGILLRNLGEKRQLELRKGLPEALDMLTVCVEAGLGFDAALSRVARNQQGPMAQECARVLQEMQFGKSRAEALRALVQRTDVAEVRSFASAIVQSSDMGITIGDVLREQAKEMRLKRRQRAEERAQKLQIKLLLPLITCLLPAIFVVVLGPAALQLVHFFSAANG